MPAQILIISEREEDIDLGKSIAAAKGMSFFSTVKDKEARDFLVDHPQTLVFWDGDDVVNSGDVSAMLQKLVPTHKSFVITDKALNRYHHLFIVPAFGHHLSRNLSGYYDDTAREIFGRLAHAALIPYPFDTSRYFQEGAPTQRITLARSGQKLAAVEAIQNYLKKQNVIPRVASLVAKAADELIMNAIFDAPALPDGTHFRRKIERQEDFELPEKERVEVSIVSADKYAAISVVDQYGSFKKRSVLDSLGKDYQENAYSVFRFDPGAGLGIHGIIQSGLSLLFVSKQSIKTEVTIFFQKTENYKDFRNAFKFVSLMAD